MILLHEGSVVPAKLFGVAGKAVALMFIANIKACRFWL